MTKNIELTKMKKNELGRVISFEGGNTFIKKLENMGIRKGVRIRKLSQQLMKGPVIVKVGRTQVGIGYGMAKKIFIEVDRK
jgi:ferrous iron transport protein A